MKATEKRPIGKTGLTVTALGVGTAPLGGLYAAVSKDDATAMLDRAWEAGIRYFDTAPMYGNGRSEHLAGALLREKNPEQRDWTVSTKVGRLMTTERAGRKLPRPAEKPA